MQEFIEGLIAFLAGSANFLIQYYLSGVISGVIPYFLPESSPVINFFRSSTGLLAMGAALAIILFVFARRLNWGKKNEVLIDEQHELLNDDQAKEAESPKMFAAMGDIKSETAKKVVPLPIKKKAIKKIYGKSREEGETENEDLFLKKSKHSNAPKNNYADYNVRQRGNVVIFKQKRPSYQRRAYRSITPKIRSSI